MDTARYWRRIRLSFISSFLLIQPGCLCGCYPGVEMIGDGLIDLERESGTGITIRDVHAYQRGESLYVAGRILPRRTGGCVTLTVLDGAGGTLAEERARVENRRPAHRSSGRPDFETTLAVAPPEGSRIRIVHKPSAQDASCPQHDEASDNAR